MVASLGWLKLWIAELISGEDRADGLTHKICEERADGLTFKNDGDRADGWTDKICEERADCSIAVEQMLVDGDGSESGGCNVAQVTPFTEVRECANSICVEDACGRWIALLETEESAAPMALEDLMALMASMVAPMDSVASMVA